MNSFYIILLFQLWNEASCGTKKRWDKAGSNFGLELSASYGTDSNTNRQLNYIRTISNSTLHNKMKPNITNRNDEVDYEFTENENQHGRPSLYDIQNVIKTVERNPYEQNKKENLVSVINVPALYEMHIKTQDGRSKQMLRVLPLAYVLNGVSNKPLLPQMPLLRVIGNPNFFVSSSQQSIRTQQPPSSFNRPVNRPFNQNGFPMYARQKPFRVPYRLPDQEVSPNEPYERLKYPNKNHSVKYRQKVKQRPYVVTHIPQTLTSNNIDGMNENVDVEKPVAQAYTMSKDTSDSAEEASGEFDKEVENVKTQLAIQQTTEPPLNIYEHDELGSRVPKTHHLVVTEATMESQQYKEIKPIHYHHRQQPTFSYVNADSEEMGKQAIREVTPPILTKSPIYKHLKHHKSEMDSIPVNDLDQAQSSNVEMRLIPKTKLHMRPDNRYRNKHIREYFLKNKGNFADDKLENSVVNIVRLQKYPIEKRRIAEDFNKNDMNAGGSQRLILRYKGKRNLPLSAFGGQNNGNTRLYRKTPDYHTSEDDHTREGSSDGQ